MTRKTTQIINQIRYWYNRGVTDPDDISYQIGPVVFDGQPPSPLAYSSVQAILSGTPPKFLTDFTGDFEHPAILELRESFMTLVKSRSAGRKLCPCGERKINSGAELCSECRARALRVCLQCGVAVGRSVNYCGDCWALRRVASRHSRQLRINGAYIIPCPACGEKMHCVEDFKICLSCGHNVLLVDGSWM